MNAKDLLIAVTIGFFLAKTCSCQKCREPLPPPKPECKCSCKRYHGDYNEYF